MKKSTKRYYLAVVMPAYNEEQNIEANLLYTSFTIGKFCDSYQIIAVNDGSRDDTEAGILSAVRKDSHIVCVSYGQNKGKGGAIAQGVAVADAKYIAFLDSDLELDPKMLRYFLRALESSDADIAIGSKMHRQSRLDYPLTRKILSIGYFIILKILFNLNLKDTQTGIKLFKSSVIKPICKDLQTSGFAFDIEILATASAKGYKIIELPVQLKYSRTKTNSSKISFGVIKKMFADTISIRKKLWDKKKAR